MSFFGMEVAAKENGRPDRIEDPCPRRPLSLREKTKTLLLVSARIELLEESDHVRALSSLRDAGKRHFAVRREVLRIGQVIVERRLIPDLVLAIAVLEVRRIVVALDRAPFAPHHAVQLGADLGLGSRTDSMAGHAHLESLLALGRVSVFGMSGACKCNECGSSNDPTHLFLHGLLYSWLQPR